jgi:hypothetical protein
MAETGNGEEEGREVKETKQKKNKNQTNMKK